MKTRFWFDLFVIVGFSLMLFTSCKKEKVILFPEVSTTEVETITPTSASCSGIVISQGSSEIIEKGICWSNEPLPTISNYKTIERLFPYFDSFLSNLTGLKANTIYFVRAFARSESGTAYGNELSFTTPFDHSGEKGTVIDIEGNIYQTIGIGDQYWTTENLKSTKYNDGTEILLVKDNIAWDFHINPGYCWYNNDSTYKNIYGALYNWDAVNTGKLCPQGWHVPSDAEWTVLETYLGGRSVAGGKMKETGNNHWKGLNRGATNESGFTGLPGGFRGSNGSFVSIREGSVFWSSTSTKTMPSAAIWRAQDYLAAEITRGGNSPNWGASVRCIKD